MDSTMRKLVMFCLANICIGPLFAAQCPSGIPPMVINEEPNWEFKFNKDQPIVNKFPVSLEMNQDIIGKNLKYSYKVNGTQPINDIQINPTTGKLDIRTDFPEKFRITITATNDCGTVEMSFNVTITQVDTSMNS